LKGHGLIDARSPTGAEASKEPRNARPNLKLATIYVINEGLAVATDAYRAAG
jgi:hypothetical protein